MCSSQSIDGKMEVFDAHVNCESMDIKLAGSELDQNLKVPFKLYKQMVREKKIADGSWLPESEWRRQKGKKSAKARRREARRVSESVPAVAVGTDPGSGSKRLMSDSSSMESLRPLVKRCLTETQIHTPQPHQFEGKEDSFREALTKHKMVIAPENYPKDRFSEEEISELQERILKEIFSVEGVCLQFRKCFAERGTLILLCGNDESRDWLQNLAQKMRVGGTEGSGVVVGEYKTLIRSTKVFLKVTGLLAQKDPKDLLSRISIQNEGISTEDWKIVGDVQTEKSRTAVLLIDELSAATLSARNWRVFVGLEEIQLGPRSGRVEHWGKGSLDQPSSSHGCSADAF